MAAKQVKPTLAITGLTLAITGFILSFAPTVTSFYFIFSGDINFLMAPAANPYFSFATTLQYISLWIVIAALVISILVAIEAIRSKNFIKGSRIVNVVMSAFILALATLLVYYAPRIESSLSPQSASDTQSTRAEEALRDYVDIEIKPLTEDSSSSVIPVMVTNKRPEATDYIIIINAFDKNGNRLGQDSIYTMDLGASETKEYKIFHSYYTKATPKQLRAAKFVIQDISVIDRTP